MWMIAEEGFTEGLLNGKSCSNCGGEVLVVVRAGQESAILDTEFAAYLCEECAVDFTENLNYVGERIRSLTGGIHANPEV